MDKAKRERGINFTLEERDILISLVFKYKDVIENKKSDATTWKHKEATWERIEKEFNAQSGGAPRTSKGLRIKYECLKRSVRKKSAAIRSDLYRTGGGTSTAVPLDSGEEKLKSLITLSADGMDSVCDSDITKESQNDLVNVTEFVIVSETPTKSENIEQVEPTSEVNDTQADTLMEVVVVPGPSSIVEDKLYCSTPNKNAKPVTSWDLSSRRNLRTKKHPALVANTPRKNLDALAEAKLELLNLQKQLTQAEIEEKKKESEFREKQRQWIEEEHLLKNLILKKQLNE